MSEPAPLISIVIPAYNRRDSVLALLADIFQQRHGSYEIIVVDDKSPDDTVAAIQAKYPAVRVLPNAVNCGPAVARNRGIREARGKYIVGFDSDVTVPDRDVLRKVVETFDAHPDAAVLAFRLFTPEGKEDSLRWWHPVPIDRYADRRFQTDYFSGTGYAARRDTFIAAKLFPEILYMHYEEVELAFRVLDTGASILYCPDLTVLHHAHPVATRSKIKVFYKPRNQILVAIGCYPWSRAITYLVPRIGYHFVHSIIHRHFIEFCRAIKSAWSLAPQRLATRTPVQRDTWRRIVKMRQSPSLV